MADDIIIEISEQSSDINISIYDNPEEITLTMNDAVLSIWGDIDGNIDNQSDLKTILDNKANISDIPVNLSDLADDNLHRLVTDTDKLNWNSKTSFSGDYEDLTNIPLTFVPSTHNQDISSINGLQTIIDNVPNTARQSVSENIVGIDYNNSSGVFSLTDGYLIPTLSAFNNKVDAEIDKGLSENNFSDYLKAKLDGIEAGAEVNHVNSVNNKTGNITLTSNDISENINLYYTNERADGRITAQKAQPLGLATLDNSGKLLNSQLPTTGSLIYKGTWDASSGNYPTLTPNIGEFWVITVAGIIGSISYSTGDWIIYSSSSWDKVPAVNAVNSVNDKTGTVVLSTTDISEGSNQYYTDIKVNNNTNVINGATAYSWGNHSSAGYAIDTSVVHNSGNETVYGNKTFDDILYVNDKLNVGSNTFDPTNPEFLKVDGGNSASVNIISAYSNYDDYVQLNIKNNNDGEYASSDFVATADIGQEGANYIDVGINNSNYASPEFDIVTALDGYMFVDGGNLAIGTATTNKNVVLFTGGSLQENKRAELSDTDLTLSVDISANNLSGVNTGDQDLSGLATNNNLLSHTTNTSNPHNVTATQVGLGNTDNTSDINKPVSTAQQIALNDLKNFAVAMSIALG